MYQLGLKIGSKDIQFTEDILRYYDEGVFQYIELFAATDTFDETISYWKQFEIPFGIHAPHSAAGLNLSIKNNRLSNSVKIKETVKFADELKADYIIFHSGVNGTGEEAASQLKPFADERFLVENKPVKGLDGSSCVGATLEELKSIISIIGHNCGFCLDFGHAICASNTLKINPIEFISQLNELHPRLYHLTDGDYNSKLDSHLHYGDGSFPLKELLRFVPDNCKVTNEAKRYFISNLEEMRKDSDFLRML